MMKKDGPILLCFNVQGFSLLEVLITMVILSVGFFAMAGVSAGVMRSHTLASHMTTATSLAQEKMEELRLGGYGFVAEQKGSLRENYGSMIPYPAFKRIVSVEDTGGVLSKMKRVTVTVFWEEDARAVSLETIVGE